MLNLKENYPLMGHCTMLQDLARFQESDQIPASLPGIQTITSAELREQNVDYRQCASRPMTLYLQILATGLHCTHSSADTAKK